MSVFTRSLWPAQQIAIEGIGSVEMSPYDMILYDAILNEDRELILMMLNRGAHPDHLIPVAVNQGVVSIIEVLIELGLNLDKLNAYLQQHQKPELRPNGVNDQNSPPMLLANDMYKLRGIGLRAAIEARNLATIELILNQLQSEEDLPFKDLALGMAVRTKDPKVVLAVLKFGHLNPNAGLHYAAQFNDPEIARLMIAHGANADLVLQLEESRQLHNMANFLRAMV